MPPIDHGNNLENSELPDNLKDLNVLERFLVTPLLPFMKMIPLRKSGQYAVKGKTLYIII